MCNKFVYHIGDDAPTYPNQQHNDSFSLNINDDLHRILINQKDFITDYFKNKKWDKYKKFSNNYELIFTSCYGLPSIAGYVPISRSYFKLWETLHDFETVLDLQHREHVHACFLAEGPGGFIEAFCNYRPDKHDTLYGMTLISPDKNIPSWKLPDKMITDHNITLYNGNDGTGSLYSLANINALVSLVGESSCDFITADGGFDFSSDFNSQEDMSSKLITAEIYSALKLQKQCGSFIIKVYDIHSLSTIRVLSLLKECYTDLFITKPLSSRPANSEKYILCTGFKEITPEFKQRALDYLENNLLLGITPTQQIVADQNFSLFVNNIVEFNAFYILRQVIYINKTLAYITGMEHLHSNSSQFKNNLKKQLRKAIKWCHKYNIPISHDSIQHYKTFYFQ